MQNQFTRTELLLGEKAMQKLYGSTVAIFGIGGVGSYAVEALARSGIGKFLLIDDDVVSVTNINRQLIATTKTVGENKVDIMRDRILDINPNAQVITHKIFYTSENADEIDLKNCSYIIDAIDTISSKLYLIEQAKKLDVLIISCMGAGNKLDPTKFEVADIYKTSVCPLARVMRYELRKRGVKKLKVVFSKEPAIKPEEIDDTTIEDNVFRKKQVPGSVAFVPSVAGLILAREVVMDLVVENA